MSMFHLGEAADAHGLVHETKFDPAEALTALDVPVPQPVDLVPSPRTEDKRGINPKDALGASKVDMSVVPPAAEMHLATAMMDGAGKYGAFNWRGNAVQARVYYAAARRHLSQWLDGEDFDPISNVHHLGHAMACCAILLDAYETGNLDDNRPTPGASGDMIRGFDTKRRFVDRLRSFFNR